MKKYIFIGALLSIIPSTAFASWWNPLTWGIFSNSSQSNQQVQVISTTTSSDNFISTSTTTIATTTAITTISTATTTEVIVATTTTPKINIPVKKVTKKVIPPVAIPSPVLQLQTPVVSNFSDDRSTVCPDGYTCTPTNQATTNSTTTLPQATYAQITALTALCTASGQDCNTVLNGYNTNAIFRSNMDIMLQQWQEKQQQTISAPCTPAENTKVLDDFLTANPEYQPINDPNSVKWNFFRNIYHSYNPTNICPQQLKDLLDKTNTEFKATYSSSQTTTSQQQTPTQGVTGNSANPLNFLYNMAPNSAVAGDQNSASTMFNPDIPSIQTQQQYQQLQQQQQANTQAQQKLQDQLDHMKYQQEMEKTQSDFQKELQFQQQMMKASRPNCNQLDFMSRISLSGGCNN